jgi:hypothetical protein
MTLVQSVSFSLLLSVSFAQRKQTSSSVYVARRRRKASRYSRKVNGNGYKETIGYHITTTMHKKRKLPPDGQVYEVAGVQELMASCA